jgi:phenylalanyl-tRNA synthetase beta chain
MIFSYNWLKEYIKGKIPKAEKLAELLILHSFEASEVKKSGKDSILDINVLTNRGSDCFSHIGIAREVAAILGSEFKLPDSEFKEDKKSKAQDFIKVKVKDKTACPRYTARVIQGVKIDSSSSWLKKRLKICGIKPINNVVDITNFVMLETGQPLHAFDLEKLEGKKIIVRYAKKRERIVTLDEKKYDLDKKILVIADSKNPVAIAGIKGGIIPEIDKKTDTIVLESANFDPRIIRRASKELDLKTDASWRFEHGIDLNLTEFAVNRAAFLIQKIAGGRVAKGLVDFYPQKPSPKKIKLNLDYVNRLLGSTISKMNIKRILRRLEFKVQDKEKNILWIEVPSFRLDIEMQEDLVEEIGRMVGYDNIKPVFPTAALIPPERNLDIFWQNFVKNILKEAGFTEVYNYYFVGDREASLLKYAKKDLIEIENPVSENYKYLRPSLIPKLLDNVVQNMKNFETIKIFELGKIFHKDHPKKHIENRALTGVIFEAEGSKDNFYELKGVCDLLLEKMGIPNFWYDSHEPTPEESKISIWHLSRSAEIKVDHREIGFLGELSPRVSKKLKIGRVVIFDFDFEALQDLASEEQGYRPVSKYPAALRDIAVLVPSTVLVEDVLQIIDKISGQLIRDVDLFDIYEGEKIPKGRKNLAFHIVYQSDEKTLNSKEVDKIHKKIIQVLNKKKGWRVRK